MILRSNSPLVAAILVATLCAGGCSGTDRSSQFGNTGGGANTVGAETGTSTDAVGGETSGNTNATGGSDAVGGNVTFGGDSNLGGQTTAPNTGGRAGTTSNPIPSDPNDSSCGNNVYNSHGCADASTTGSCKSGSVTITNGSYYCGDTPGILSLCSNGTLVDVMDCHSDCLWYGAGTGTKYSTSCWNEDSNTVDSKSLKMTEGPGCYYARNLECGA